MDLKLAANANMNSMKFAERAPHNTTDKQNERVVAYLIKNNTQTVTEFVKPTPFLHHGAAMTARTQVSHQNHDIDGENIVLMP